MGLFGERCGLGKTKHYRDTSIQFIGIEFQLTFTPECSPKGEFIYQKVEVIAINLQGRAGGAGTWIGTAIAGGNRAGGNVTTKGVF